MATQALFDRLFSLPSERFNIYVEGNLLQFAPEWRTGEDERFLIGRSLVIIDWYEGLVDAYEWEFTEEAWAKAEVIDNRIYIEDVDGDD